MVWWGDSDSLSIVLLCLELCLQARVLADVGLVVAVELVGHLLSPVQLLGKLPMFLNPGLQAKGWVSAAVCSSARCDAWVLVHKLPYSCAFSRAVLLSLQLSLDIKEPSTEGPQQVSLLFCAARHYPNNSASKSEGGGCKQALLDCACVTESHRLECGQFVPARARHSSKCWHAGLARGPSAPLHRCPRGLHGSSWPEGVREGGKEGNAAL